MYISLYKNPFDCRSFNVTKLSSQTLFNIYKMGHTLESLSLTNCEIRVLPENFFQFLPVLRHLDLRRNLLVSLPSSLAYHPHIENLLLSDNLFDQIPVILSTLPKLQQHGLENHLKVRRQNRSDYTRFFAQV